MPAEPQLAGAWLMRVGGQVRGAIWTWTSQAGAKTMGRAITCRLVIAIHRATMYMEMAMPPTGSAHQ